MCYLRTTAGILNKNLKLDPSLGSPVSMWLMSIFDSSLYYISLASEGHNICVVIYVLYTIFCYLLINKTQEVLICRLY